MNKRYQVFVSSTFEDLIEERQEVTQALLELDCIPAGMELFPAANDDQWTLIKRVIDDCDYYIVIIGGRYGSVGPAGISFTQMEYQYATEKSIPVIAFLHKDPGKLIADKTEKDPEKVKKLENFKELAKKKMVKFWDSPKDLGSVVSRSLIKLTKDEPAVGWVKASLLPDKSLTEENLKLRKEIDRLKTTLEDVSVSVPAGVEDLAKEDDDIELHYTYDIESDFGPSTRHKESLKTSWNKIFSIISPAMINEASDMKLKNLLNEFVAKSNPEHLGTQPQNFILQNEDFNTIKVQFLALGLIKKSEKDKSVKDRITYWTLTPYGESVMIKLLAIKK